MVSDAELENPDKLTAEKQITIKKQADYLNRYFSKGDTHRVYISRILRVSLRYRDTYMFGVTNSCLIRIKIQMVI